MDGIPLRPFLTMAPRSGIMVSKSIQNNIPSGTESLNQQTLCKRNPNIIYSNAAVFKILLIQIVSRMNALIVIAKTFV